MDFVYSLFDSLDILCLQEHWLRPQALHILNGISTEFNAVSISGMDEDITTVGRPYGGLVVFYKGTIVKLIKSFLHCINKRCMAILVEYHGYEVLVFNVYFPCKGDINYQADVDIICGFIESVIFDVSKPDLCIAVAGDFNENILNIQDLPHLNTLHDLINTNGLVPCTKFCSGPIQYTFQCVSRDVYSMLDNVLVNGMFDFVDIFNDVNNRSDHLAVICHVRLENKNNENSRTNFKNVHISHTYSSKYVWSENNKRQYYEETGSLCY
jgi:hypothetical protein